MPKKHYILSADDEPMNQAILQEILEDEYELACVNDGRECLDSIDKRMPDLVLMDVKMPNMNGLDACRKIRGRTDTAGLKIIMMSALASRTEIGAGIAAGADDYISKPYNVDALSQMIKSCLENTTPQSDINT